MRYLFSEMHTEPPLSTVRDRSENESPEIYYPALPSSSVTEFGRRLIGALNRYE